MAELTGKTALVTGGNRGIGRATVQQLATAGAKVMFTARSPESVAQAMEGFRHLANVSGHVCDVRDEGAMSSLIESGCDILVNNASIATPLGRLHEVPISEWKECIDINLLSAVHAARLAIIQMLKSGGGTVINVSSGASRRAIEYSGAYCVSKAGLAMATMSMHLEYASHGVRVFGFGPGVVDTGMQQQLRKSGLYHDNLPERSALLSPDEPARVIRWLCCDDADQFCGRELGILDEDLRQAMSLQ